jgi:hypothetical protein
LSINTSSTTESFLTPPSSPIKSKKEPLQPLQPMQSFNLGILIAASLDSKSSKELPRRDIEKISPFCASNEVRSSSTTHESTKRAFENICPNPKPPSTPFKKTPTSTKKASPFLLINESCKAGHLFYQDRKIIVKQMVPVIFLTFLEF